MMKDEAAGKITQEFVGLRAKQYSFKMWEDSSEHKKCKGIRKNVVKNRISHDDCDVPRLDVLSTASLFPAFLLWTYVTCLLWL